jgi:hypothetical protein
MYNAQGVEKKDGMGWGPRDFFPAPTPPVQTEDDMLDTMDMWATLAAAKTEGDV